MDFTATVASIRQPENNHVIRIAVPAPWMRYVFAKGYIAINGASLTVADANKAEGWFEVWLIPETLRMTTFGDKQPETPAAARNAPVNAAADLNVGAIDYSAAGRTDWSRGSLSCALP